MNPITAPVDATDPLVTAITWGLTWAVGRILDETETDTARAYLPVVALFIAVVTRSMLDSMAGHAVSVETLLRAVAAAGVAVMTHSQFRELTKKPEDVKPAKRRTPRPPNPKL